jgi:hypothetical protein
LAGIGIQGVRWRGKKEEDPGWKEEEEEATVDWNDDGSRAG